MKILFCLLFLTLPVRADIVIGVVGPMAGPYAGFGQAMQNGAQLAVDDLNAAGGIAGEMVVLQPLDDACDNRKAELAAQELIAKNVKMVVGHFCSNPALSAAKLYAQAGIPMIAPSASLPPLTDAGLNNVIRLASRQDVQGDVAAKAIGSHEIVAVLSDGLPANVALVSRFIANLRKPPKVALTFKPEASDFDGLISDLKANNITSVYLACSASDAGHIALALKEAGVETQIFGSDSLLVDQYWEVASDAANGTKVTFATDPRSSIEAKPITAALKLQGYEATGTSIAAYAAVQLFAAAPQDTANKLKSGEVFKTALGPLSFDAKGDVREARYVWYQLNNGKFTEVK